MSRYNSSVIFFKQRFVLKYKSAGERSIVLLSTPPPSSTLFLLILVDLSMHYLRVAKLMNHISPDQERSTSVIPGRQVIVGGRYVRGKGRSWSTRRRRPMSTVTMRRQLESILGSKHALRRRRGLMSMRYEEVETEAEEQEEKQRYDESKKSSR